MIELYAVTDDPVPPSPPVRGVGAEGLTVLVAPAGPTREATPDDLWRHERIVEELMDGRDLLPVRFGTRLDGEEEVGLALAGRGGELRAALERVRGAVEVAVRAIGDADPELLHAALLASAREGIVRDGPELLRAAYLVDRDFVAAFVAVVTELQRPGLDLLCTGPWPPYSFAEAP